MKEFLKKSAIFFLTGITAFSLILPPQVFAQAISGDIQSEGTSANEPVFFIDPSDSENKKISQQNQPEATEDTTQPDSVKIDSPKKDGGQGPQTANDPPYSTVQPESSIKQIKPEVDLSSGALVYRYPINLPPGRNNLTPEIAITYNSQDRKDGSPVGYGWTLEIPYIIRENKYGQDQMYVTGYERFSSSIDGPLTLVSGNQFYARNDNGAFNQYKHIVAGLDDYWELKTKEGRIYIFGKSANARIKLPPPSIGPAYLWMLEIVEDANGNKINFTYKKHQNQVYPDTIKYMSPNPTQGGNELFLVEFKWDPASAFVRSDIHTSYENGLDFGFGITTEKTLTSIDVKENSSLVKKYEFQYAVNISNSRTHLQSIQEKGYGATGNVSLPQTSFTYTPDQSISFVSNTTNQFPPTDPKINSLDFTNGVVVTDVNGDGYVDVLQSYYVANPSQTEKHVWLNNRDHTFTEATSTWQIPNIPNGGPIFLCSRATTSSPCDATGAVFFDIDSDALGDFVYAPHPGPSGSSVHLNSGSGWAHASAWDGNVQSFDPKTDLRPFVADVTGEGLADQLRISSAGGSQLYKNTGSSSMQYLAFVGSSTLPSWNGLRVLDLNNDGLADVYRSFENPWNTYDVKIFTNQAHGFADDSSWGPLFGSNALENPNGTTKMFFTDLNGDNRPDYITDIGHLYLNIWKRWQYAGIVLGPPVTGVKSRQVGDVDGNGLLDVFYNVCNPNCTTEIFYNLSTPPDILTQITLPTGGKIDVGYRNSTEYKKQSGELLNPELPFTVRTVATTTETDLVGGASYTSTYSYANGRYYFNNPFDRKFAGFESVTKTRPDNTKEITYFHQGNNTNSTLFEYADHQSKIGKPFREDVLDSADNLVQRTTTKWETTALASVNNGRYFVRPIQTITENYDGNSSHKDTATTFTFDTATGDLTQEKSWGEVNASNPINFTDVGNDLITKDYSYATDSQRMRLLSQTTAKDSGNNVVSETKITYDNLPFGQVSKGNPTKEERLISGTAYASTTRVYNNFGLLLEERDPMANPTTYAYDSVNLYPATTTNALNQQIQYLYDYTLGAPRHITDPNGEIRETVYDALDRVIEEKAPNPANGALTTVRTVSYNAAPNAYSETETKVLSPSLSVDTVTYFDSFGRIIQMRARAEDQTGATYATRDTAYDFAGRVAKESLPYFSAGAAKTVPTTNQALYTNYQYDANGRATLISNALGATNIAYDDWIETLTDPNGNLKKISRDAFSRLNRVEEYLTSTSTPYVTAYEWSAIGNLIKITDALNNIRNFTYDKLGRRLSAEDLHAPSDNTFGSYSFTYDLANNLTQKQTPVGDTINYSYDAINRPVSEDFLGQSGIEVIYGYDTCTRGIGRLCSETKSIYSGSYAYDYAGNRNTENKTIETVPYATNYTYDFQGNQLTITNPNGSVITYTYNLAAKPETVSYTPQGGSLATVVSNIDYSPTGEVVFQKNANNTEITNLYDSSELYRLKEKSLGITASSTAIQKFLYNYDAVGNVTRIVVASDVSTTTNRIADYGYDGLYRLTSANITASTTQNSYSENFTYNAIGNILTGPAGSYSYNGNQGSSYANPHAATTIGTLNLTYDQNGNIIFGSTGISDVVNFWDYNNRLVKTSIPVPVFGGGMFMGGFEEIPPDEIYYEYDSKDIRIAMGGNAAGVATTTYPTVFYNTDGAKQTEHLFAGGIPVATIEKTTGSPTYFWNSQDHLNSTSVVTDSNSNTVAETEYTAFGSIQSNTWSHPEQRKYTGHEYDVKTGLTYARQRYFDTSYGRFLSQDPVFLAIGDPSLQSKLLGSAFTGDILGNSLRGQSSDRAALEALLKNPQALNSYSYALNNPVKFVDREGEIIFSATAIGILVGASILYNILDIAIAKFERDIKLAPSPIKTEIFTQKEKDAARGKFGLSVASALSDIGGDPVTIIGGSVLSATLTIGSEIFKESGRTRQAQTYTSRRDSNQFTGLNNTAYQQTLQDISAQLQAIRSLLNSIRKQISALK